MLQPDLMTPSALVMGAPVPFEFDTIDRSTKKIKAAELFPAKA